MQEPEPIPTGFERICVECGVYKAVHQNGRCVICQGRAESDVVQEMIGDLGLPPDSITRRWEISYGGETPWHGMHKFLLGIPASSEVWPPPWPYVRVGPMLTHIWLEQIEIDGLVAFVEARWHPEFGRTIETRRQETIRTERELQRANEAFRMLKLLEPDPKPPMGRPKESRIYPTAAAFRDKRDAVRLQFAQNGVLRPTVNQIAFDMCISRSSYMKYQREFRAQGLLD